MTPIAIASLAALAGMFVILDAAAGDRRLQVAGYRARVAVSARLGVVAVAVFVIVLAALVITATVFDARQWTWYAGGSLMRGMTYALVGVIIGPLFGRVAGVFIAFLIPFLDLGIAQSPMLRPMPEEQAIALPGYGWTKVLFNAAFTADFDQLGPLLVGLAWFGGTLIVAVLVLAQGRRATR